MNFRKRVARGLALNSSLGRSITFCMVALLVAGIATSAWTLTRSWQKEVADAEREAINLSVSQARQAEDTFLQAETALRDIRRNLPATGLSDINNHQFNNYLSELQQHIPQLHGLMVYDPQGNMIATSFGKIPAQSNNSDREYFIYHRRNGHGSIHIGHVIRSRSTGDLVIPVSLRISDSAGGFTGVLLATVKLDYFRHFYSYFELQNRDLLALLNTDGNTLYVRPFADDVINRNLSASPLFTQELEKKDRGNGTWGFRAGPC